MKQPASRISQNVLLKAQRPCFYFMYIIQWRIKFSYYRIRRCLKLWTLNSSTVQCPPCNGKKRGRVRVRNTLTKDNYRFEVRLYNCGWYDHRFPGWMSRMVYNSSWLYQCCYHKGVTMKHGHNWEATCCWHFQHSGNNTGAGKRLS